MASTRGDYVTNEVCATHLSADTYFDARIQNFRRLGDYDATDDAQQGMTLPWVRLDDIYDLAPGMGRINLSVDLLGVQRLDDQVDAVSCGVPYVFGYEGNKVHLKAEAAWETQWILPAGVTATPISAPASMPRTMMAQVHYPGARLRTSLLSVTPIASMDFRWPLMAQNGPDTHLLEPVMQIVYRGSSTTKVGITNDNAQSFVFDDANLFSLDRFTGSDRQETGLRANLGFHYAANFGNGGWLDVTAGKSFHLAGFNAMGIPGRNQCRRQHMSWRAGLMLRRGGPRRLRARSKAPARFSSAPPSASAVPVWASNTPITATPPNSATSSSPPTRPSASRMTSTKSRPMSAFLSWTIGPSMAG